MPCTAGCIANVPDTDLTKEWKQIFKKIGVLFYVKEGSIVVLNNTPTLPNIYPKTVGWVIGFSFLFHSLTAVYQYLGNTTLPREVL